MGINNAPRNHEGILESSLSWRARGVLSYAMTHDEPINRELVMRMGGIGRDAAGSVINELVDLGYLDRERYYIKKKIPDYIREQVLARDGYRCVECESRKRLSVDHVLPERLGGDMSPGNLQTLCMPCNAEKGVKP